MEDEVDMVFRVVKPMCVQVVKQTNLETLKAFEKLLNTLAPVHIDCLAEYLLFPVRFILKQPSVVANEDLVRLDLKCLQLIMSRSSEELKRWETFVDIFSLLLCLLDSPGVNKGRSLNESFILETLDGCKLLLTKVSPAIWIENLVSATDAHDSADRSQSRKKFSLTLGHFVYVMLQLTKADHSIDVQLSALAALDRFLDLSSTSVGNSDVLKLKLAETLAQFIPGISTTLCTVAADSSRNHLVVVAALKAFRKVILLVMPDDIPNKGDGVQSSGCLVRTRLWIEETVKNLNPLLCKALTAQHDHWMSRQTAAETARLFIQNCSVSMSLCLGTFLDVVIVSSEDSYHEVADDSRHFLDKLALDGGANERLKDVVEGNLYALSERLPRTVRVTDVEENLDDLKLVLGNLRLLGSSGIAKLCNSQLHLEKFMMAMFQVTKIHSPQIRSVQEIVIRPTSTQSLLPCDGFGHRRSMTLIGDIFKEFGCKCPILIVVDYVTELMSLGTSLFSNQAIFALNRMMLGFCSNIEAPQLDEEWDAVGNLYLEELEKTCTDCDNLKTDAAESSILRQILLLEGLANWSELIIPLKPSQTDHVSKTIYSIIKCYSSGNLTVQQTSLVCLQRLATVGSKNVSQLIHANLDTLKVSLLTRLQHYSLNERCPLVLVSLLRLGFSMELFTGLLDVFNEILSTLDRHYMQRCTLCLTVLLELVKCIKAHLPEFPTSPKPAKEPPPLENFDELIEGELVEAERTPVPPHISVIRDILHRTKHFLSSPVGDLLLVTLDILNESLCCLTGWTDELLPLIHQNWLGLSRRFAEHLAKPHSTLVSVNLQPAIKAFQIICTMVEASGDFVYRKVTDDIFPSLTTFLETQWKSSLATKQFYQHSDVFKLQLAILQQLGHLCVNIRGADKEYLMVGRLCALYFHKCQPAALVDAAVNAVSICFSHPNDIGSLSIETLKEVVEDFQSPELYHGGLNRVYNVTPQM